MGKKDKDIDLFTLNALCDAIAKASERPKEEPGVVMARTIKDLVDDFEKAGFSHEDAMNLTSTIIKASIPNVNGVKE